MKDNILKINLIQSSLVWENPNANRDQLSKIIDDLRDPGDLILLPEMFNTGFSMNTASLAETERGPTLTWMKEQSHRTGACICGSLIIKEDNHYFNRFFAINKDEILAVYDKRHLFRMGAEHSHFMPGNSRVVFNLGAWRISPFICYDLRFPVWMRSTNNYDLALVTANWPSVRSYAWKSLLIARAVENQSFIAGVNRVGEDGNGINHSGNSMLISPEGAIMDELPDQQEGIIYQEINLAEVERFRLIFPAWMDSDEFILG